MSIMRTMCTICVLCGKPYRSDKEAENCPCEYSKAEQAIADGTIAKADQAEQEAIVEEPLDDPWDQMAENLRVLVEAIALRDWHSTKVRTAAKMATTLLPKLRANRDAEVRELKDALWDTVSPATVGDGIESKALKDEIRDLKNTFACLERIRPLSGSLDDGISRATEVGVDAVKKALLP